VFGETELAKKSTLQTELAKHKNENIHMACKIVNPNTATSFKMADLCRMQKNLRNFQGGFGSAQ
jgi:hypothetical protein